MPTIDTTPPTRTGTGGDEDTGFAGENVLVLASADDSRVAEYCAERLDRRGAPSPNALLVSLDESPDRRFDAVVGHGSGRPAGVAVVGCDGTRGAAAASAGTGHGPGLAPGPWVATVGSPSDLTGLGVRIRQALSNWEHDAAPVEVCFHDLDTLLGHVDDRAAFRFCHAVTRHVRSVGATSHFHLDPDAVSERTLNTLRPLFDRVVDRR
jgi:hypothetical protein